jgi:uncharacterized protein YhaN
MKLERLKLENWRGVASREIQFADGITLIEGPNEIGKSTIVEAIQTVFTVMDSSNKGDIKAIQPVGKDVGSSVEVEVRAGNYHFVYAKTYNKNKQTELRVLTPQVEQLTGREAHERVAQILEESVDMALWNALLVEQGNEIAGVTLSQSDGLARALDEAAGGESPEQDDADLFARVQAEYELYFTLKTGKPKYAAMEVQLNDMREALHGAREALVEVENDRDSYERCQIEIARLEAELPELRKQEREYESKWLEISKLKEQVAVKQQALNVAQELLQASVEEAERRQRLTKSVAEGLQNLQASREALSPLAEQLHRLKESADAAKSALNAATDKFKNARAAAELTRADAQYLEQAAMLEASRNKLTQLQEYTTAYAITRKSLQGIKIDAEGLELLRRAENELQVALAKLGTATSSIQIAAHSRLKGLLNGEDLALQSGEVEERAFASELKFEIPGVATVRVTPSQSANELESEAADRRETLARLFVKYGVADLADAIAVETKRAADERDATSWNQKIAALLGNDKTQDLQARVDDLQARCRDYATQRAAEPPLPASLALAQVVMAEADKLLIESEQTVEQQQAAWDELRDKYADASAQFRVAEQEVRGQEKIVAQRQQDLALSRTGEDDQALKKRVADKTAVVDALKKQVTVLHDQLESVAPDAAEALFANAQAASQRAAKDLTFQQTQLAVLEDRLTKAQADGRYEALEAAEQRFAALEDEYAAVSTRAAAAARLWQVLSSRRDAARKAYVRPLKEGVEQLGRIVFGSDFAIELGDNWELISRTQDGKTIVFDDLSVGAKEQLGILMRLAAARIVSKQGGVPLIVDDALGFSDPSRLKTMGAAIASAGHDCQIILLTCTPGRFTHVGNAQVVRF